MIAVRVGSGADRLRHRPGAGGAGLKNQPPGHGAPVSKLRTSPPPPDAEELQTWVLDSTAQLHELRAGLIEALNRHDPSTRDELADVPDRMVLVATELATNAIRHGIPPTVVRLLQTRDGFVLDVADHDLTTIPELADTRPLDSGGRGLHLANAFALEVGWYASDSTKHIWAAFARTGPAEVRSAPARP